LILDLAVTGRLIDGKRQDDSTRESVEFLNSNNNTPTIKVKEMVNPSVSSLRKHLDASLPATWKIVQLNDIANVIRGVTYGKSDASDIRRFGDIQLLRGNNIQDALNFDDPIFIPKKLVGSEQVLVKGDIVIAMSSGSADLVGKSAQYDDGEVDCTFGAFCGVIRPKSLDLAGYLALFFKSPLYRREVASFGKGIGINNLQKSSLLKLDVPIPSNQEQGRIVAKVNELMLLCDRLEQRLNEASQAHNFLIKVWMDVLLQSKNSEVFENNWNSIFKLFEKIFTTEFSIELLKDVLHELAVTGKLSTQDPSDKPAIELLNEKNTHQSYKEVLPNQWVAATLDEFALKITDGEHFRPPTQESGVYFLSAKDIREEGVSLDDPLYISAETSEKALKRCNPEYGDVLIVSRGATVGRACKVNIREVFCLLGSVILIKSNLVLGDYLVLALRSPTIKKLLINASGSTAQPAIYLRDLKKIVFPIPPLQEQMRIVKKMKELNSFCEELKLHISSLNQWKTKMSDVIGDI
jgi:type I restriction enzyme S subunit